MIKYGGGPFTFIKKQNERNSSISFPSVKLCGPLKTVPWAVAHIRAMAYKSKTFDLTERLLLCPSLGREATKWQLIPLKKFKGVRGHAPPEKFENLHAVMAILVLIE